MQRQKNSLHLILTQPCQKSIPIMYNLRVINLANYPQSINPAKPDDCGEYVAVGILNLLPALA
jgi:hypothetical protein